MDLYFLFHHPAICATKKIFAHILQYAFIEIFITESLWLCAYLAWIRPLILVLIWKGIDRRGEERWRKDTGGKEREEGKNGGEIETRQVMVWGIRRMKKFHSSIVPRSKPENKCKSILIKAKKQMTLHLQNAI